MVKEIESITIAISLQTGKVMKIPSEHEMKAQRQGEFEYPALPNLIITYTI